MKQLKRHRQRAYRGATAMQSCHVENDIGIRLCTLAAAAVYAYCAVHLSYNERPSTVPSTLSGAHQCATRLRGFAQR